LPPISPFAAIILFAGSGRALQFTDAGFTSLENGNTFEFVGFIKRGVSDDILYYI
jgi:hypothetical protein